MGECMVRGEVWGVGGQTVLEKYAYFEKNGWVGDFDAFAEIFSVCSAIFFLTPLTLVYQEQNSHTYFKKTSISKLCYLCVLTAHPLTSNGRELRVKSNYDDPLACFVVL